MLVGDAANRTECDKELAKFLKHTNLYCATTFMGKGTVSDKYPRSLHTVGMGMKDIAVEAFDAADLVICVGYDMVEWPPAHWNAVGKKKIIHINMCPSTTTCINNSNLSSSSNKMTNIPNISFHCLLT